MSAICIRHTLSRTPKLQAVLPQQKELHLFKIDHFSATNNTKYPWISVKKSQAGSPQQANI